MRFTNDFGAKVSPLIGYFVTNVGGIFTPKLFCETHPSFTNDLGSGVRFTKDSGSKRFPQMCYFVAICVESVTPNR